MGIHDRDYFREDEPRGGLNVASWSVVTQLIVVNVALYFADMFSVQGEAPNERHWLFENMCARPESLWPPLYWWQFLTNGFAHSWTGLGHIALNMLTLGMFGRHVEPIYGRREFLRFYLFTVVLCSVLWAVKEKFLFPAQHHSLLGASGAVSAVFMLYVCHFPRQTLLFNFFIPMPAWLVGAIMIAMNVFTVRMPGQENAGNIAFDVHLVGIAFAFAYYRFQWRISNFLPSLDWVTSIRRKLRTRRTRSRLKLHDPEPSVPDAQLEAQGDRVLAKIKAEGDASLTSAERRILEKYSERLRQRKRERNQP